MNISKIRTILDLPIPDENKSDMILAVISEDEKAIPYLLNILQFERERKKDLILESNAELSKAYVALDSKRMDKDFVMQGIKAHWDKWKDLVSCCFKID